jgi:hypothetical protein
MSSKRLIGLLIATQVMLALLIGCDASTFGSDVAVDSSACVYREGSSETLIIGSTLLLPGAAMDNGGVVILPSGKIGEVAGFDEISAIECLSQ